MNKLITLIIEIVLKPKQNHLTSVVSEEKKGKGMAFGQEKKMRWKRQKASSHQHLTVFLLWELCSEGPSGLLPESVSFAELQNIRKQPTVSLGRFGKYYAKAEKTVFGKLKKG